MTDVELQDLAADLLVRYGNNRVSLPDAILEIVAMANSYQERERHGVRPRRPWRRAHDRSDAALKLVPVANGHQERDDA